jgi:hypothetical protein
VTVVEWLRLPDVPVNMSVYVPAGVPAVVGGFTVSDAVLVVPPYEAEIITCVELVTALVLTIKVVLLAPAATVTLAGTIAADPLLESETPAPPVGAAPLRLTVPVDGDPPLTVMGLSPSEYSVVVPGGPP